MIPLHWRWASSGPLRSGTLYLMPTMSQHTAIRSTLAIMTAPASKQDVAALNRKSRARSFVAVASHAYGVGKVVTALNVDLEYALATVLAIS
jgi:hypothetical protein